MRKIWFCAVSFSLLLAVISSPLLAQHLSISPEPVAALDGRSYPPPTRLIDIVVESDPLVLKGNNEEKIANFLKDKNNKIIDYLITKYPQYGIPDVDVNDPAATWFGLFCAMYEGVQFKPLNSVKYKSVSVIQEIPAWLSCTLNVIGAGFGINEIIGSLGAFSYGTVWKVVKFVVKKYVTGWLTTALTLYQIADECF